MELLPDGPDRRLELLTDGPIDLSDGAVGEGKEVSDYSDIVHKSFYQNLEISSFNSKVYFHTVILETFFRCKMKKNGLFSQF